MTPFSGIILKMRLSFISVVCASQAKGASLPPFLSTPPFTETLINFPLNYYFVLNNIADIFCPTRCLIKAGNRERKEASSGDNWCLKKKYWVRVFPVTDYWLINMTKNLYASCLSGRLTIFSIASPWCCVGCLERDGRCLYVWEGLRLSIQDTWAYYM